MPFLCSNEIAEPEQFIISNVKQVPNAVIGRIAIGLSRAEVKHTKIHFLALPVIETALMGAHD